MLRDRLGFTGWRYDMVLGYHPRFVGLYNERTVRIYPSANAGVNGTQSSAGLTAAGLSIARETRWHSIFQRARTCTRPSHTIVTGA